MSRSCFPLHLFVFIPIIILDFIIGPLNDHNECYKDALISLTTWIIFSGIINTGNCVSLIFVGEESCITLNIFTIILNLTFCGLISQCQVWTDLKQPKLSEKS